MSHYATPVQLPRITGVLMLPGMSVDPLAQQEREEEQPERLSVDLPAATARFLERFAAYRNALNDLQGRQVKKWTRKSAAEAFVESQVRSVAESMDAAFKEHGELPDAKDEKAVLAYAKTVLASASKSAKKSSR